MVQFGKDEEIFSPLIDLVFKSIFTRNSPESKGALIDFLESVTGRKIDDVSVMKNELPVRSPNEKKSVMDLHCSFAGGDQANIEVQVRPWGNLCARAEYYVSKLHCSQTLKGLEYEEIKYTYQITIADYPVFVGQDGFFSEYEYRDEQGRPLLGGRTKLFFLELTKLQAALEKPLKELTKPEKWALYLKFANDPRMRSMINQLIVEEGGLAMASNILHQITKDDHLRAAIFAQEKAENDRLAQEAYFRRIGREEGLQKATIEIARRMLASGISLSSIAEMTNLPEDQLKNLLNL